MKKKTKTKIRKGKKLICQAKVGAVWFNVYVNYGGSDAGFVQKYSATKTNTMEIGIGGDRPYEQALDNLMHEAVEAALTFRGGAYYKTVEDRGIPAYIHFMFSHETYQRSISEAVSFMMVVEPKLRAEWERHNPKGRDSYES